jgi:hypothetical protein
MNQDKLFLKNVKKKFDFILRMVYHCKMKTKELVEKYLKTDSISEKTELKELLTYNCAEFAEKEYMLYQKYKMPQQSQYRGDYRPNRGVLYVLSVSEKEIKCEYQDYCLGGNYYDTLRFSVDDLENKDFVRLENEVKQKRIQHLQNKRYEHLSEIDLIDREIVKLFK